MNEHQLRRFSQLRLFGLLILPYYCTHWFIFWSNLIQKVDTTTLTAVQCQLQYCYVSTYLKANPSSKAIIESAACCAATAAPEVVIAPH